MEFKNTPALQGHEPRLLEDTPAGSKLLSAMKVLEHRLEHIEHGTGNGHANGAVLESGIEMNAETEPATSSSMSLLLAKGQVLLETERLQEAVACFQEAITVDPENSEAHLKKGIATAAFSNTPSPTPLSGCGVVITASKPLPLFYHR